MERFDETMCLFRQALGWRIPLYITMNVANKKRDEKLFVSQETRKLIEDQNKLDMALYAHVSHNMEQVIRDKGRAFEKELQRYRRLNRIYGFTFGSAWQVKMMVLQKIT